jgi:hypothetical protein
MKLLDFQRYLQRSPRASRAGWTHARPERAPQPRTRECQFVSVASDVGPKSPTHRRHRGLGLSNPGLSHISADLVASAWESPPLSARRPAKGRFAAVTAARAHAVQLHGAAMDPKSFQLLSLVVQRYVDMSDVDVPHLAAAPADEVVVIVRIGIELSGGAAPLQRADQTGAHQLPHIAIHGRM